MRNFSWRRIAVALCLVASTSAGAYEGTVNDAATGRPVSGAWVLGRWEVGGGIAHGAAGCMIAIDRTDAIGRFTLEGRDGLLGRWFPIRDRPAIEIYLSGYRETPESIKGHGDVYTVERDPSSVDDRLHHITRLLGYTDCGDRSMAAHNEALRPLYRAIGDEGAALAGTARQRGVQTIAQDYIEMLDRAISATR